MKLPSQKGVSILKSLLQARMIGEWLSRLSTVAGVSIGKWFVNNEDMAYGHDLWHHGRLCKGREVPGLSRIVSPSWQMSSKACALMRWRVWHAQ